MFFFRDQKNNLFSSVSLPMGSVPAFYPCMVRVPMDTVSVWVGYGYNFIATGTICNIPVKLWVEHGYNLVSTGISIHWPFVYLIRGGLIFILVRL